jgi:CDP-paratose 2-epimerase
MKKNKSILITGGCGFVGTNLAIYLQKKLKNFSIYSVDNLKKKYSKFNLDILKKKKIKNFKIDISSSKFLKLKKKFNFIIDCSADPAVENSKENTKSVFNNNLKTTLNILEKTRKDKSNIIFISSSRVYPIMESYKKFRSKFSSNFDENTNTNGVKSIYGFTKYASELLIKEYSYIFDIKFIINRSGIITGPLQFGKVEQGLVSLWLWRHLNNLKLNYIGYGGKGSQIRDILYIDDFSLLIKKQILGFEKNNNKLFCIGGGKKNSLTLRQLTEKCQEITSNYLKIGFYKKTSKYDIPIFISSNKQIKKNYNWSPKTNIDEILKFNLSWMKKNYKRIKRFF